MNKQIEEMAKVIANKTTLSIIEATGIAEILICEDYRKDSDVARKIFAELETVLATIRVPRMRADGSLYTAQLPGFHIRTEDYNTIKKNYLEDKK